MSKKHKTGSRVDAVSSPRSVKTLVHNVARTPRLHGPAHPSATQSVVEAAVPPDGGPPGRWWHAVVQEPIAWGLAVVVFLRPWRDGITFPRDNAFFMWAIVVLITLWVARVLWRGESIRYGTPIALLTGFLAVAALTTPDTVQFDATYRNLLWWSGHAGVFILATNALRSRRSLAIVLGAFAATSFFEGVYGYLHLEYVLPYTRLMVNLDPGVLSTNFGLEKLTAQLQDRLSSNRAFGSLLFPNALAAFMILGIPYALGSVVQSARELRGALAGGMAAADAKTKQEQLLISAAVGAVTWFAIFLFSYFVFFILSTHKYYHLELDPRINRQVPVTDPFVDHLGVWSFYFGVLPLCGAAAALILTRIKGWTVSRWAIRMTFFALLALVESYALWLTLSRGGILGLLGALAAGAVLLWFARKPTKPAVRTRTAQAAAALLLAGMLAALSLMAPADAAPEPSAASPAPVVPSTPSTPPPITLDLTGVDHSAQQIASLSTFRLRLSYWKTSWYMIRDNLWSGVGLGNFGTVYPKYQYLGAGDVKMAHNDYLQIACETGVFGLLAFGAFWGYFLLWGARRIVRESNVSERWLLTGLYCSVVAFLLHSVVDFNFYNSSLALNQFLLAGIFLSRAAPLETAPANRTLHQIVLLPILAAAWLMAGTQVRLYLLDAIVENKGLMMGKPSIAEDFLRRADAASFDPNNPPRFGLMNLKSFIPDRPELERFGRILAPVPGKVEMYRYLDAKAPLPPDLEYVSLLELTNPEAAQKRMRQAIDTWINELIAMDRRYPHSPQLASHIYSWYDILVNNPLGAPASLPAAGGAAGAPSSASEDRRRWAIEAQKWAEKASERSPEEYWLRGVLGKALYVRAMLEPDSKQAGEFLMRGLEQYRRAKDLYPTSAEICDQYATALDQAGKAFARAGDTARGDAMIAESEKVKARAAQIRDFKVRVIPGEAG